MNQDQRLIPFLGGLIVGGVGGSMVNNNLPYYNYPPYYSNYQYPTYNYYPPYPQYIENTPIAINGYNQSESIYASKIINEPPFPISLNANREIIFDNSYVPPYHK